MEKRVKKWSKGPEVEPSAHPLSERGTVDSSKRIEQVLQNPRSHFQETAAAVESAARAPRTRRLFSAAPAGSENPRGCHGGGEGEKLLLTAVTTN
jgi:hypothetical protein